MHTGTIGLSAVWALLAVAFHASVIPVSRFLRDLRLFLLLSVLIFLATLLADTGESVGVTLPSLHRAPAALLAVWRFLSMVSIGILLTATTDPTGIQQAAYWFTKYIPGVPSHRVATMVMLTIRFVPLIFDEALEIRKACRSRLLDARKNRIAGIIAMGMPLMSSLIRRGDETALAMASRGYSEDRIPIIRSSPSANLLCASAAVCIVVIGLLF
jgi:energy-coupling factor transporter transmembrane protein EcfT